MDNSDIAAVLQETADLIELTDGNPHRARAFSRAARTLSDLNAPVRPRIESDTLTDLSGVGGAMAEHIADVAATGTFELHDELLNAIPPGLLDVMRVKGLGTKRTRRLWQELDIRSLDDLEAAAEADRITSLSGFGAKTQSNILENLRQLRAYEGQWRYAEVWNAVTPLLSALRTLDQVQRAEPTGPLRRACETLEQADLLVAPDDPAALTPLLEDAFDEDPSENDGRLSGTLKGELPVHVHLTTPETFGTAWWRTTGSAEHMEAFEARYGPPSEEQAEASVYEQAGLSPIPPALREHRSELDAADAGTLPALITAEDLHGSLHNHSTDSDGAASLATMADAARDLGFSYFGICDHSQSLQIASGLSPGEVREQHEAVADLNASYGDDFRIFHGIESDIRRDGSLDYERDVLDLLDFVVASVHTGFSMTEAEATERVVRAVENPYTRILGHPTGRLLLARDGYPLDHERVIEACAQHDVAIELNANPYRLDLDWRWIRHATDQGVLISINPDAHATDELEYVTWGIAAARKGWLTADQCLNAKSLPAFADWVEDGRSSTA